MENQTQQTQQTQNNNTLAMIEQYLPTCQDVANSLGLNINGAVLFNHITKMLSNGSQQQVQAEHVFNFVCQCKQLNLNPLTNQIYGFLSGGKVLSIISVSGWTSLANRNPNYDGYDIEASPLRARDLIYKGYVKQKGQSVYTTITEPNKLVHDFITIKMYRKDRSHPIVVTTYFDEVYRETEVWAKSPNLMLQNRAFCNAVKRAFGVDGYTEDEKELIQNSNMYTHMQENNILIEEQKNKKVDDVLINAINQ